MPYSDNLISSYGDISHVATGSIQVTQCEKVTRVGGALVRSMLGWALASGGQLLGPCWGGHSLRVGTCEVHSAYTVNKFLIRLGWESVGPTISVHNHHARFGRVRAIL